MQVPPTWRARPGEPLLIVAQPALDALPESTFRTPAPGIDCGGSIRSPPRSRMPMRALPLLTLLLPLLASCERSPTGATPEETTLAFRMKRGDTGEWQTFSARGQQPAGTAFETRGPWVYVLQGESNLILFAHQEAGGGWRSIHLTVSLLPGYENARLGSVDAGTCPDPEGRPCTLAGFLLQGGDGIMETCIVLAGELVRTRSTEDRVSGRFSGTGHCSRAPGETRSFTVSDGTFDVQLPPPAPAPG